MKKKPSVTKPAETPAQTSSVGKGWSVTTTTIPPVAAKKPITFSFPEIHSLICDAVDQVAKAYPLGSLERASALSSIGFISSNLYGRKLRELSVPDETVVAMVYENKGT